MIRTLFGTRYRVALAPVERPACSSPASPLMAVVFETEEGRWVGSIPIHYEATLESLADRELEWILRRAQERE